MVIQEFLTSLAHFILVYSETENLLKEVIAHDCRVSPAVGRALFSDMRLRPIIDKIRKVHEAKKRKILPRLEEAFAQLAAINDMRDKLLHQGFDHQGEGQFVTTNMSLAYSPAKIKTLPVSALTLGKV